MHNSYNEIKAKVEQYFGTGRSESGNRRLTSENQGRMVFDFVKKTSNNAWICEIGSLYGYITTVMGLACLGSNRRIVTIDHMIGGYCMSMDRRPKCIYLELVDNLRHFGVWDKIVPFPMKSHGIQYDELYQKEPYSANFLREVHFQAYEMLHLSGVVFEYMYIDGNHSKPNVLLELELYTKLLKKGGVVTGDDCGVHGKPFLEAFKRGNVPGTYSNGVAEAVFEFFVDNGEFEPVEAAGNQFGFRKL